MGRPRISPRGKLGATIENKCRLHSEVMELALAALMRFVSLGRVISLAESSTAGVPEPNPDPFRACLISQIDVKCDC